MKKPIGAIQSYANSKKPHVVKFLKGLIEVAQPYAIPTLIGLFRFLKWLTEQAVRLLGPIIISVTIVACTVLAGTDLGKEALESITEWTVKEVFRVSDVKIAVFDTLDLLNSGYFFRRLH